MSTTSTRKRKPLTDIQVAYNQQVGTILKSYRIERGWSLREMARRLGDVGVTRNGNTTVYNWEQGDRRIPIDLLPFFAEVFEVDVCDLLPKTEN